MNEHPFILLAVSDGLVVVAYSVERHCQIPLCPSTESPDTPWAICALLSHTYIFCRDWISNKNIKYKLNTDLPSLPTCGYMQLSFQPVFQLIMSVSRFYAMFISHAKSESLSPPRLLECWSSYLLYFFLWLIGLFVVCHVLCDHLFSACPSPYVVIGSWVCILVMCTSADVIANRGSNGIQDCYSVVQYGQK